MRPFKIFFSILFVLAVGFGVAKILISQKKSAPIIEPYSTGISVVEKKRPDVAPKTEAAFPRMAIILDDWGENYGLTRQAIEIGRPLTLAVLPHLRYSRKISEEAHRNGLGVMLHMPMEPQKLREHMEPQTILTTTPDLDVVRYLDEALDSVLYAEGVNNHTGSKATTDERVMRLVLRRLKERNLFFVDSFVTKETVAPDVARDIGLPFAKRSIFIDNVVKKDSILAEIERAKEIALKKGQVVVIGHDKKTTLAAIKEAIPGIEKAGIRLVFVRDLVKAPRV